MFWLLLNLILCSHKRRIFKKRNKLFNKNKIHLENSNKPSTPIITKTNIKESFLDNNLNDNNVSSKETIKDINKTVKNKNEEEKNYEDEISSKDEISSEDEISSKDEISSEDETDDVTTLEDQKIYNLLELKNSILKNIYDYLSSNPIDKIENLDYMREIMNTDVIEFLILVFIGRFDDFEMPIYDTIKNYNFFKTNELIMDIKCKRSTFLYSYILLLSAANFEFLADNNVSNIPFLSLNVDVMEEDLIDTLKNMFVFIDYMANKYVLNKIEKNNMIVLYTNLFNQLLHDENIERIKNKKEVLNALQNILFDENNSLRQDFREYFSYEDTKSKIMFFRSILLFLATYVPNENINSQFYSKHIVYLSKHMFNNIISVLETIEIVKDAIKKFHGFQRRVLYMIKNPQFEKQDRFWIKFLDSLIVFRDYNLAIEKTLMNGHYLPDYMRDLLVGNLEKEAKAFYKLNESLKVNRSKNKILDDMMSKLEKNYPKETDNIFSVKKIKKRDILRE
ncbi:hypothetical protein DMUE_4069 [Dictyocoela muelleri]|nr:hypothetical protein DMUE_4069 [Dictyocoela muelleri]